MQEILLAIWGAVLRFRSEASERTWIYRLAHNVALTFSGTRRRQVRSEEPIDEMLEPTFTREDPKRLELLQAIHRLEPLDRQLACLYLEGFSAREMEEVSGLNANAVGVRLHRLRERLRRELTAVPVEKASNP